MKKSSSRKRYKTPSAVGIHAKTVKEGGIRMGPDGKKWVSVHQKKTAYWLRLRIISTTSGMGKRRSTTKLRRSGHSRCVLDEEDEKRREKCKQESKRKEKLHLKNFEIICSGGKCKLREK